MTGEGGAILESSSIISTIGEISREGEGGEEEEVSEQ